MIAQSRPRGNKDFAAHLRDTHLRGNLTVSPRL
jgi:hypothetical protein